MVVPAAGAHDPGQGEAAGTVAWDVRVAGRVAEVRVRGRQLCAGGPTRIVARRGGRKLSVPARGSGGVRRATVRLPEDGRWFVYVQVDHGTRRLESWVPVIAGKRQRTVSAARYAYQASTGGSRSVKWLTGALLYAAMVALVAVLGRSAQPGDVNRP